MTLVDILLCLFCVAQIVLDVWIVVRVLNVSLVITGITNWMAKAARLINVDQV